jgi:uncharacterized protein DUF4386
MAIVFRSGFLPRILGVLLIAACFGYLADSLTPLLLPNYADNRGQIREHPVNDGRTSDYLVAFDQGRKGSTIGSRSLKRAEHLALSSRSTDSERVVGQRRSIHRRYSRVT